jgi:hypothetical protein
MQSHMTDKLIYRAEMPSTTTHSLRSDLVMREGSGDIGVHAVGDEAAVADMG